MAAGFMAGFGTNFAKLMEDDRRYFREQAAKKRDYIQTYGTRAVTEREDKANSIMAVANNLQTRGFKPSTVRYVLDTNGITGLLELQDTANKRTDITNDEIDSIVTKAADYVSKNPDEDMNTVIKRAFGLYKSETNPVKRDRNAFSAILGFDNAMLEDQVLDDMYINGYTGRDIYRIMGSAGPTAGAALQLDLPTKPLSETVQYKYAEFMRDKMNIGIDSRITMLKTKMTKEGANKEELQSAINALETIKGRGLNGLADYAEKFDPSIYTYAKALDEDKPGSITSNSFLLGFREAFNEHFEAEEPEEKQGLTDDDLGLPTDSVDLGSFDSSSKKTTHKVTSEAEALDLLKSGKVKIGDKFDINGTIRPVESLPESALKTTDLGDLTGAPGFRDELVSSTTSALEAGKATRAYIADAIPEAGSVVSVASNAAAAGIDALMNASDFMAGLTGLDEFEGVGSGKTLPEKAESGRELAQSMRDHAEEVFTMGFSEYMRSLTGEDVPKAVVAEVKENLDTDKVIRAIGTVGFQDFSLRDDVRDDTSVEIPKRSSWTPTSKPTGDGGKDLRTDDVLFDMLVYDRQNVALPDSFYIDEGFTQEQLNRVKKEVDAAFEGADLEVEEPANVATRASDTPAYRQLQELLLERVALANKPAKEKKKKEVTIKKKAEKILTDLGDMTGAPGFRTKEVSLLNLILADELPESVVELVKNNPRAVGTVGFRDLGLRDTTDDVRERQNQPADLQMSAARGPSPTEDSRFFDTPKSMTVENMTTRGVHNTPRGLMSPTRESAPKLGQAEFGDLIKRVHGSSKAAEAFNKKVSSGKLTAADVTRLLKATQKLPETSSRQRLIASLFRLRDGLNKR